MSYKLIFSIVPHNQGDEIVKAAHTAGAGGGTVLMGMGTASNNILSLLGFGNAGKDVVLILVPEEIKIGVLETLVEVSKQKKKHYGVVWTVDVSKLIKCGSEMGEKNQMNEKADYQMISIIVNKGYAEDAMAAARTAGAGGGTIINARGTAKEGDAKFFGMEIVPEKDLLVILVPNEQCDAVIEAVKKLPCLQTPGSGITFCSSAHDFTLLGSK
ncbi:MAG: transcriptional regulator [Treponema sp.]|nr:transcriptional regulator [Treponema sp.]